MTTSLPVLDEAEIAIVGGGPAGSIAAFTLASRGHDVILIDKRAFPRDKACGDGLTSSAVAFLHQLGLEQVLANAQSIDAVRLFVDWREHETIPMHGSVGQPYQPCCIPREQFDHAMVKMACAAGARLVQGYVTQPLHGDGRVVGVEFTRGTEQMAIRSHYVLGADGATSRLRRQLDGQPPRSGTFAYAVRQYVHSDRLFTPSFEVYAPLPEGVTNYGYGWVFPIGEGVANVGIGYLSTHGLPHPRSINELLDSFLSTLRRYQGARLGKLDPIGRAIGGQFGGDFTAERCQIDGVVFLGDAAQATDPITGEGIDQAMRSAYTAALALDSAIRRRARPTEIGQAIRRANLRLGQNNAMIARVAHKLLKRRGAQRADSTHFLSDSTPLLSTAAAMLTADVAYPSLVATPVGELASRLGCVDHLAALDERLRDEVDSGFILAAELVQREVCAGIGPLAALTVIASELACGSKPSSRSVDAALCVELLCAYPTILSRTSAADTLYASTNNTLAVIIGDYSLCRALTSAPNLGAKVSEDLGEAIEANSEGIALLARDPTQVACPVGRYVEGVRLTSGASLSLAARMGACLAGAQEAIIDALGQAGETLGIALQIAEDILSLTAPDPVTGRQPWRILMEGCFRMPVILAVEEEPRIVSLLAGAKTRTEWEDVTDIIMNTGAPERAGKVCREYAESAKKMISETAGRTTPLKVLCDLPPDSFPRPSSLSSTEPKISLAAQPAGPAVNDVALRSAS
jgi:geranylgeranyl reductase family protein